MTQILDQVKNLKWDLDRLRGSIWKVKGLMRTKKLWNTALQRRYDDLTNSIKSLEYSWEDYSRAISGFEKERKKVMKDGT